MPPQPWAMSDQLQFLCEEDEQWRFVKSGGGTLKGFYARTAQTFLEKWPIVPDAATLKEAGGDEAEAKKLVADLVLGRISNWYSNHHRQKKQSPPVAKALLDLGGKNSRKKPPLQKWQAFSSLYYRPKNSPLRAEMKSLYDKRHDPTVVGFLTEFLSPDIDIATTDHLTFLGAFSRERCTHLSTREEEEVEEYIEKQQLLTAEQRDRPWFLDDDFEDNPLLAENRYIQQRISELPRVSQRALDEIEKATGFKAVLLVGGLTPAGNGSITTYVHTSGRAIATGLSFIDSWSGSSELCKAFGDWLQMMYTDEEKVRREGYSAKSLAPTSDDEPITPTELPPLNKPASPDGLMLTMPNEPEQTTPDQAPVPNLSPAPPQTDVLFGPVSVLTTALVPISVPSPATEGERESPPVHRPPSTTPLPVIPPPVTPTMPSSVISPPVTPNGTLATPDPTPPIMSHPNLPCPGPPPPGPSPPGSPPLNRPLLNYDSSYPNFITPATITHLNSVNGGSQWVEMVKDYLRLESQYPSRRPGRLSLQNRPEEVSSWGRQRDFVPSIIDIQRFQEKWLSWWGSCQPKWRSTERWPYSHEDADGKDWTRLNATGPYGLFAVVMSTSWWAVSTDLHLHRETFHAAVEDLHWVIKNLIRISSEPQVANTGFEVAAAAGFPGHGERGPGKRKVKPTPKVCTRDN